MRRSTLNLLLALSFGGCARTEDQATGPVVAPDAGVPDLAVAQGCTDDCGVPPEPTSNVVVLGGSGTAFGAGDDGSSGVKPDGKGGITLDNEGLAATLPRSSGSPTPARGPSRRSTRAA
jgi:hypothetical protein